MKMILKLLLNTIESSSIKHFRYLDQFFLQFFKFDSTNLFHESKYFDKTKPCSVYVKNENCR